jgi:hypothetical protein
LGGYLSFTAAIAVAALASRDTGETVATGAGPPVKIAASPEASIPHHAFLDVGAGMANGVGVWPRRDT